MKDKGSQAGWGFWLGWVLASFVGWIVGWIVANILGLSFGQIGDSDNGFISILGDIISGADSGL